MIRLRRLVSFPRTEDRPVTGRSRPFFALTTRRLLVAVLFVSIFAMAVRVPMDSDTWWHLRSGQWMVENRTIPLADPFSWTMAGQPWIDQSWLAQIGLYAVYALAGEIGLALLVAGMVTLTLALVYRQRSGNEFIRAFALVLAAATSGVFWTARPQMASFALTAATALVVWRYRQHPEQNRRMLWLLPPGFALWANLHAGFAAGFLVIGCAVIGEAADRLLARPALSWGAIGRLALTGLISALAVCLNPNGPAMLLYPFRTVSIGPLQDYIQEWASPNFHLVYQQPFIWLLLATLGAIGLSGMGASVTDLLGIGVFAYLALLAGRNIALFAVVATPVLVHHADAALVAWRQRIGGPARRTILAGRRTQVVNAVLLLLVVFAAGLKVAVALNPAESRRAQAAELPLAAIDHLRQYRLAYRTVSESGSALGHAPSATGNIRLFNAYNWGGYLVWALYPDIRVFVDGRTDLFAGPVLEAYVQVAFARSGWEEVLDRYGVNVILVEADSPLAVRLAAEGAQPAGPSGWRLEYQDAQAVMYVR